MPPDESPAPRDEDPEYGGLVDRLVARLPRWVLVALVAILAAFAVLRMEAGYRGLLIVAPAVRSAGFYVATGLGAVDLVSRRIEAIDYFAAEAGRRQVYPPATYALLWPFIASGSVEAARWTWAVVVGAALAWLCRACALACGFRDPRTRLAFGLLPLTFLATSSAVAVGQLTPVVIALLVASTLRLARSPRSFRDDAIGASLFALAAVKPTLAAPFGWLLLFVPHSLRPAALAAAVYGALTAVALIGRHVGVTAAAVASHAVATTALRVHGGAVAAKPSPPLPRLTPDPIGAAASSLRRTKRVLQGGYANLQNLLVDRGVDLPWLMLPALLVLAAFGLWAWRRRRADPWVLLGVGGLVARFAFYHRFYDDMLVIPALVALARLASGALATAGGGRVVVAAGLSRMALATLLFTVGAMLAPRNFPPFEWRALAATCGWITALFVLVVAVGPGATARGWTRPASE